MKIVWMLLEMFFDLSNLILLSSVILFVFFTLFLHTSNFSTTFFANLSVGHNYHLLAESSVIMLTTATPS